MGTSRGAVTKIVNRLIKKSLVKRRALRGDGYLQILTLTRKGVALVPELQKLSDASVAEIFKWLINDDLLPVMPSLIGRVCSGYAPQGGVLQTPSV